MIPKRYGASRFEDEFRVAKALKPRPRRRPRISVRQRIRRLLQTSLHSEDAKLVSSLLLLISAPYLLLQMVTFGPSVVRMLVSNALPL